MLRKSVLVASAIAVMGLSSASVFACDSAHPEDFSGFFARFAKDKAFAVKRTLYPSLRTRYEYGLENGKQQITETHLKVSKQEDMRYPALGEYLMSVGLEPAPKQVSGTEALVEITQPGAAWLVTYYFSARRGCWFLREIRNHAL